MKLRHLAKLLSFSINKLIPMERITINHNVFMEKPLFVIYVYQSPTIKIALYARLVII